MRYAFTFINLAECLLNSGLLQGGDLDSYIVKKREEMQHFSISDILHWSKEILLGLKYIHSNSVVHRDIKPKYENFLSILVGIVY